MESFIGTINAKIDSKGRAFLPAPFRKILQSSGESHLVLRKDVYKDCLILYPETTWKEELSKLQSKLNDWDEQERELFRQISMNVEKLELDSNGRILISKQYLLDASISNDVRFIGINRTIEIWNPDQLKKSLLSADDFKKQVQKLLGSKPENKIIDL